MPTIFKDVKKLEKAVIKDSVTGDVSKVVNFHDTEFGTESAPANITVHGNIFGSPSVDENTSYLRTTAGLTVVTQSNNQVLISSNDVLRPDSINGLQLWLEANNSYFSLGSNGIERWADLSPNKNHLTQTTSSLQPKLAISNPNFLDLNGNSLPTVDFQLSQLMTAAQPLSLSSFTIIIGAQVKSNGSIIYEHGTNAVLNDGSNVLTSVSTSTGASITSRRSGTLSQKDLANGSTWASQNSYPFLITHQFGGLHSSHRISISNWDATTTDAAANSPNTATTTAPFSIGARIGNTLGLSGSISCIAVYSPAITPAQAGRVARYFGQQFGIHVL